MRLRFFLVCALLTLSCQFAQAQHRPNDPIGESLFPPDLIMQHQQAIGLSEDQKNSLRTEILKAQQRFTDLQWQIEEATERLAALLKQDLVDEQQAIVQLDKVLSIEREIKRAQFALLIQIKNRLNAEQRTLLMQIRKGLQR